MAASLAATHYCLFLCHNWVHSTLINHLLVWSFICLLKGCVASFVTGWGMHYQAHKKVHYVSSALYKIAVWLQKQGRIRHTLPTLASTFSTPTQFSENQTQTTCHQTSLAFCNDLFSLWFPAHLLYPCLGYRNSRVWNYMLCWASMILSSIKKDQRFLQNNFHKC